MYCIKWAIIFFISPPLFSLFFVGDLQLAVYGVVGTMRMIAYVVNTGTGITVLITSIIVKLFPLFFFIPFFPIPIH